MTNERTGSVNMTTTNILTNLVLVESERTTTIHAPVERVNIADWILHLPDAEYQRCAPPDHIAAGTTTTDDGWPMSINVEADQLNIKLRMVEMADFERAIAVPRRRHTQFPEERCRLRSGSRPLAFGDLLMTRSMFGG